MVTRAVSEADSTPSPTQRMRDAQPAAGRRHSARRGRKRTRSDAVQPTLDPSALEPPGFVEAPDFIGLEQVTVERIARFIAILRGDPVIPEENNGPSGRGR
ncbi:MAG: hypothetical protein F4237_01470 [Gemmatimonadetes bacterium]|nr:hypothetical protein [Gemmatimonadota bacterium]